MSKTKLSTNLLIKISLLAAVAVVFMAYFEFTIFPAFYWLKIDISDIPAIIGAFAYGPIAGVIIEGLKILLYFLFKGTQTGGIGELANIIIGAALVIPAGVLYSRNRTRKTAIISLITSTICMTVAGVFANYFLLIPLFKNFLPDLKNSAYVTKYILYGVIPFNLIKGVLISVVTVLIYKKVSVLILRERAEAEKNNSSKKTA